jgi:predicted Zn-dependent protease
MEARVLLGRAQLLGDHVRAAEQTLIEATKELPVDPLAFRYLADASERLGHLAAAHEALTRYVALVGDYDVPQTAVERLDGLARRIGADRSTPVRAGDRR